MTRTEEQIAIQLQRSKQYRAKPHQTQRVIIDMLLILQAFGIPFEGLGARRLENIAMSVLAVADVRDPSGWADAKDAGQGRSLKTRDIIDFINDSFGEQVSKGSYDDVRRKNLDLPLLQGVVIRTSPGSARNNPTRGYALDGSHAAVIRTYGSPSWTTTVDSFMTNRSRLSDLLVGTRSVPRVPIRVPSGETLLFGPGEHNELQKAVIEEFLPRYGYGADVLYVGDAENKTKHIEREYLQSLSFFELEHGELPDVVAYSPSRNWLYLIGAVHSSGPISPNRLYILGNLTKECTADIIYVTAFRNRETFRRFVDEIAWETEVWIAEAPDHLIHFNGEKFLGPHQLGL